jgi:hypothetical protein
VLERIGLVLTEVELVEHPAQAAVSAVGARAA